MPHRLDAALDRFHPVLPLAVGLSGGADSTALLLACAQRWPGQLQAIHVHHGLQAAADGFEQHCRQLCAQLQVPLQVQRVDARPVPGQSPEDAARQARYQAFSAAALDSQAQAAIKSIALAHHADDQVETLLLALSRGAGVAGLAAMPAQWQRAGVEIVHQARQGLGTAGLVAMHGGGDQQARAGLQREVLVQAQVAQRHGLGWREPHASGLRPG